MGNPARRSHHFQTDRRQWQQRPQRRMRNGADVRQPVGDVIRSQVCREPQPVGAQGFAPCSRIERAGSQNHSEQGAAAEQQDKGRGYTEPSWFVFACSSSCCAACSSSESCRPIARTACTSRVFIYVATLLADNADEPFSHDCYLPSLNCCHLALASICCYAVPDGTGHAPSNPVE